MYSFSYLEPVCCSMSSSNCCFLTCIQVSQEAGQVVWYSHILQNFPQFIVIYTVKGFGIANKAEIDCTFSLSKTEPLIPLQNLFLSLPFTSQYMAMPLSLSRTLEALLTSVSLSHPITDLSAKPCGSTFKTYPEPNTFSPLPWYTQAHPHQVRDPRHNNSPLNYCNGLPVSFPNSVLGALINSQ